MVLIRQGSLRLGAVGSAGESMALLGLGWAREGSFGGGMARQVRGASGPYRVRPAKVCFGTSQLVMVANGHYMDSPDSGWLDQARHAAGAQGSIGIEESRCHMDVFEGPTRGE
jgi:hypothetical protein